MSSGQVKRRKYQDESTKVSMVSVSRRAGPPQVGQVTFRRTPVRASGESPTCLMLQRRWQNHRKVILRDRHHAAGVAVDDRDRASPVTLAGDAPVAEAELFGAGSLAMLGQVTAMAALAGPLRHAGERAGVHQDAVLLVGLGEAVGRQRLPRGLDHHLDRQAVLPGELEVPLVVGGHRHDRAGAVVHEDEVGDPDRHRLCR